LYLTFSAFSAALPFSGRCRFFSAGNEQVLRKQVLVVT